MTATETKEELDAIKSRLADKNLEDLTLGKFKKYLSKSFGKPQRSDISTDITASYHQLTESELMILESKDEERFLGTLYRPTTKNSNSQVSILTVVGTHTKSYHLFLNLFIDHRDILNQAKKTASKRFQEIFPLITNKYETGLLRPYSEPADAPSPLIVQKFSKFLGIPYKVTYHAVYWKSRAILSI